MLRSLDETALPNYVEKLHNDESHDGSGWASAALSAYAYAMAEVANRNVSESGWSSHVHRPRRLVIAAVKAGLRSSSSAANT
jgi:hypothetical protein